MLMFSPAFLTCVSSALFLGLSGNVYYTKLRADAQDRQSKKIEGQAERANRQLEHLHDHLDREQRERQIDAIVKEVIGEGGRDAFVKKIYGDLYKDN